MAIELRIQTVVLPGGKIEITTPELIPGQRATVVVTVENSKQNEPAHVIDILKSLPGHRLFRTADEVDNYMRQEHDACDNTFRKVSSLNVVVLNEVENIADSGRIEEEPPMNQLI